MSLFHDHQGEELGADEEAEIHRILGGIQGHPYEAGSSGMACVAMVELPDSTGADCGRPATDPVHQDPAWTDVGHTTAEDPVFGRPGQDVTAVNAIIRQRIARSLTTATDQVQLCLGYLDTIGQVRAADDIRGVLVGLDNARQTHPVLTQPREDRHV